LSKKILVAALDWGLGHASRCIPLIRKLIAAGFEPILASSGDAYVFLKNEFPGLKHIELPGYHIRYASGNYLMLRLVAQLPGIFRTIRMENDLLKSIVDLEDIGCVISDNRYGLWNKKTYNIFVCHQLFVQAPQGFALIEPLLARIHRHFIQKFDECWVPDYKEAPNLSGSLSHGRNLPGNTHYIGPQSRFLPSAEPSANSQPGSILVILSGPEPQRSLLEAKLISGLAAYEEKITLVRGIFSNHDAPVTKGNITIYQHLCSSDLKQHLQQASLVICRAGYSSVMDLAALQKRAILIPTPGQTEQLFLAKYHDFSGNFVMMDQDEPDILSVVRTCHGMAIQNEWKNRSVGTCHGMSIQKAKRLETAVFQQRIEFVIGKL
jgi:uncharacterized protein (TIGR00661 family)